METDTTIRYIEVRDGAAKSAYTRKVLEGLPQWFGNEQALNGYVADVAPLHFWAAMDANDQCVGFFAVKTHYGHTGDIYVCGVQQEHHRSGIGRALYRLAEAHFIQIGCKHIIVKTLSDISPNESYKKTRKFYEGVGFEPLITLPELWDEDNPCLIMIKTLS